MPLQIIRQDITKIECDAIVNPSNEMLFPTGGTDLAIHEAAGPELLRQCLVIGGCTTGEAVITPAFSLPCRYVIHTAGPVWDGGNSGEETLLVSCYSNCLKTAEENGCRSIAIPLISSGRYGVPKEKVLTTAISTISSFLFENEMLVYLVVFDKTSYELSEKLFSSIQTYIDDNYVQKTYYDCCKSSVMYSMSECCAMSSIDDYIVLDESFAQKLIKLIDAKGMDDVACYKRANVSKHTWHKLMTDKNYKPNKKTAVSFAIALELTLPETQNLLSALGFVLSDSSLSDVIIKYCLENSVYDVFEIDSVLFKYDQETLFSTL